MIVYLVRPGHWAQANKVSFPLSNAAVSSSARVGARFFARVQLEAKGYTVWHTAPSASRMNEKV